MKRAAKVPRKRTAGKGQTNSGASNRQTSPAASKAQKQLAKANDTSELFRRVFRGEKVAHREFDPLSKCDAILSVELSGGGGIKTHRLRCPIHGLLPGQFVGP